MCIRDSAGAAAADVGLGADARIERLLAVEFGRRVHRAAGPVSYTHLRAHETVLDLVCRLLLEKKTNSKNHTRS